MKLFWRKALILLAVIAGLSACSASGVREEYDDSGRVTAREYKGGDPNYAQYVAAMSQQKPAGVDAMACQGDARCVEHVAALAALAQVAGGNRANIAPPAPKKTTGDRIESVVKGALGILPALGGQYVGLESSRNSRDVALAQYGFLGGVITDVTGASAVIAQSGPRIDVGGDYVGGDRSEIGDNYTGGDRTDTNVGGDQVGGDQQIGDNVGRDQAGRDIIDNGGIIGDGNDQRQDSPGPYDIDNSDDGDDCTDSDCSQLPPDDDRG